MSEYKRFVSYIYEYPNYQKGPNRGFLKVECRNGICQMNFSLRGICRDDNGIAKIYGFRRENARLLGTLLSEGEVTGGVMNLQVRFPEKEIGDQHFRMEELCGVILLTEEEQLCATQWDDDPLDFTGFPNITQEEPEEPEVLAAEIQEPEEHEAPAAEVPEPEEITLEEQEIPEPREHEAPAVDIPEPEEITLEEQDVPEPEEPVMPVAEAPEPEEIPLEEQDVPEPEEPVMPVIGTPEPEEIAPEYPEAAELDTILPEDAAVPSQEELCATCRNPDTTQPKPWFRDGRIVGCRQISQKDIRQLNPADWYLANNRFVLYGQQVFGHLLIGQLAESGQTVLCVPGIYHQQERALAGMYGFTCFAPCPGHADRPRGFGYWYRLIQPADGDMGDGRP